MKKQTKARYFNDIANAVKQIRAGEPVKRIGTKDGSIATRPVVYVDPRKLEADVLADCLGWLELHHVFCHRHDSGSFKNDRSQWGTYGIKNSGDIHGMLALYGGKHFEIECKRGSGGRQTEGQQKRMKDVHDNDSLYFVCHGVEELVYFMKEWV